MPLFHQIPPVAPTLSLSDLRPVFNSPSSIDDFQSALTDYLNVTSLYLTSSGRTALYLLLHALANAPEYVHRRRVLLPGYTCPAVAKVILDVGLQPCFIDLVPQTLTFEPTQLTRHLDQETLAVICVHPFGMPQPLSEIQMMARSVGALVIEDAAQAMGASLGGERVGTLGDFGIFSLGPGKALSTGGGGLLTVNRIEQRELIAQNRAKIIRPARQTRLGVVARLGLLILAFQPRSWWLATRLGLHHLGNNEVSWGYRPTPLTAVQGAVGTALLPKLDRVNCQRRTQAAQLIAGLQSTPGIHIPPTPSSSDPIYLRLPLLIDDPDRRERIFRRLWAAGISAGKMYQHPLPHFFPQHHHIDNLLPGAEQIARSLLTLPTHHHLKEAHIARICQVVHSTR